MHAALYAVRITWLNSENTAFRSVGTRLIVRIRGVTFFCVKQPLVESGMAELVDN